MSKSAFLRSAKLSGIAAIAVTATVAAPVFAQEATDEVEYAQDAGAYAQPADDVPIPEGNEIVVTATKREQTLQDVPVAVTVTSEETLERAEIRDLKDLTTVVPSLRVTQLQSSSNTNFIIRGFGNGANNAGIEPSVGVFIDGVYRSRSAARINDLPDLQRIEVLRGPQSTLFGKNASAGVISVVTNEPRFNFGGEGELSYGNYNAMVAKANVYGPVSDTIAASFGVGINKRDGYIEDLGTFSDTNGRDRWFTRGQFLFEPNALFKLRLIGDYESATENCCGTVFLQPGPTALAVNAVGGQFNDPNDPFADVIYSNFNSTNDIDNYGGSAQADFGFGPFGITSITAYRGVDSITDQDSDFTSADIIGRNFADLKIRTFTQELRATAQVGAFDVLLGAFYFDESIDQDSQLFFGDDYRGYADGLIRQQSGGALTAATLEQQFGALLGDPTRFQNQFFIGDRGLDENLTLDNESYSFFGQADFRPIDRLTLTAGLNYTKDKKTFSSDITTTDVFSTLVLSDFRNGLANAGISQAIGGILGVPGGFASPEQIQGFASLQPDIFSQIQQGALAQTAPLLGLSVLQFLPPFLNVPNAVEDGKTNDDDLSVTLRAAYDLGDSLNVYAAYATGYKAPSVNLSRDSRPRAEDGAALAAAGLTVPNLTFGTRFAGAEQSEVYELGVKGNFGRRASFNLAVFQQTIEGFQSNIFTGRGFELRNAGEQQVRGVEFESEFRPVPNLSLRAAATYLDAEYKEFQFSSVGDLTGTRPAGVPKLSSTVSAEYEFPIGAADALIARGDYHYESKTDVIEGLPGFLSQGQDVAQTIDDRFTRQVDEVNASLTYISATGLELSIWGRNLLDDRYLLSLFDSPAQQFSISGYPNQPRTYGATLRYKFGAQ